MKNFSVQEWGRCIWRRLPETLTGILLVAALAWLYYDSVLAVPFLLPLLIVWHREWEQSRMEKEKEQFRMQFREWILLLSSSLTAGYSVENAFGQSLRELRLMFPGGGAMLEALQEMVLACRKQSAPGTAIEGSGRKASAGRSRGVSWKYSVRQEQAVEA